METLLRTMPICKTQDVVLARQAGRELAEGMQFSSTDGTRIATAISEITRNVLQHSGTVGEIRFYRVDEEGMGGLRMVVEDKGIGIADLSRAMEQGYSTSGSLGAGLPGSKRLMDLFQIATTAGQGTIVSMTKWTRQCL